jgi:hypothetical protein
MSQMFIDAMAGFTAGAQEAGATVQQAQLRQADAAWKNRDLALREELQKENLESSKQVRSLREAEATRATERFAQEKKGYGTEDLQREILTSQLGEKKDLLAETKDDRRNVALRESRKQVGKWYALSKEPGFEGVFSQDFLDNQMKEETALSMLGGLDSDISSRSTRILPEYGAGDKTTRSGKTTNGKLNKVDAGDLDSAVETRLKTLEALNKLMYNPDGTPNKGFAENKAVKAEVETLLSDLQKLNAKSTEMLMQGNAQEGLAMMNSAYGSLNPMLDLVAKKQAAFNAHMKKNAERNVDLGQGEAGKPVVPIQGPMVEPFKLQPEPEVVPPFKAGVQPDLKPASRTAESLSFRDQVLKDQGSAELTVPRSEAVTMLENRLEENGIKGDAKAILEKRFGKGPYSRAEVKEYLEKYFN